MKHHGIKQLWIAGLTAGALALAPLALAEDAAAPAAAPAEAAAETPGVSLTAEGDHVVKVETGNEAVDAAANYAAKCAERAAALKACDQAGGFKAMGCRKVAELRYKNVTNCPAL